jgi:hypothetical protein
LETNSDLQRHAAAVRLRPDEFGGFNEANAYYYPFLPSEVEPFSVVLTVDYDTKS